MPPGVPHDPWELTPQQLEVQQRERDLALFPDQLYHHLGLDSYMRAKQSKQKNPSLVKQRNVAMMPVAPPTGDSDSDKTVFIPQSSDGEVVEHVTDSLPPFGVTVDSHDNKPRHRRGPLLPARATLVKYNQVKSTGGKKPSMARNFAALPMTTNVAPGLAKPKVAKGSKVNMVTPASRGHAHLHNELEQMISLATQPTVPNGAKRASQPAKLDVPKANHSYNKLVSGHVPTIAKGPKVRIVSQRATVEDARDVNSCGPSDTPRREPTPLSTILAQRAGTDPDLKTIMNLVAAGKATPSQLSSFQKHVDECNKLLQEQKPVPSPKPDSTHEPNFVYKPLDWGVPIAYEFSGKRSPIALAKSLTYADREHLRMPEKFCGTSTIGRGHARTEQDIFMQKKLQDLHDESLVQFIDAASHMANIKDDSGLRVKEDFGDEVDNHPLNDYQERLKEEHKNRSKTQDPWGNIDAHSYHGWGGFKSPVHWGNADSHHGSENGWNGVVECETGPAIATPPGYSPSWIGYNGHFFNPDKLSGEPAGPEPSFTSDVVFGEADGPTSSETGTPEETLAAVKQKASSKKQKSTPSSKNAQKKSKRRDKVPRAQLSQIIIKLTDDTGDTFYKLNRTTPLKRVMQDFCDRKEKSMGRLRFIFDGCDMNPKDTPDSIGIEDLDTIEVHPIADDTEDASVGNSGPICGLYEESSEDVETNSASEEEPSGECGAWDETTFPSLQKAKSDGIAGKAFKTLLISNISPRIDEKCLWNEFYKFGEIISCYVVHSRDWASPGSGYIEFSTAADALMAQIAMDRYELKGYEIGVKLTVIQEGMKTLRVMHITDCTDEEIIRHTFRGLGEITSCHMQEGDDWHLRWADIEFANEADARKAQLKMDRYPLKVYGYDDLELEVDFIPQSHESDTEVIHDTVEPKSDARVDEGPKTLCVSRIGGKVDEDLLRRQFGSFGEIVSCRVVFGYGWEPPCGYVEFGSSIDAAKAQATMNNNFLEDDFYGDLRIRVEFDTFSKSDEHDTEAACDVCESKVVCDELEADVLADEDIKTLLVSNISIWVSEDEIQNEFERFGELVSCHMAREFDSQTGRFEVSATIEFVNAEDANKARIVMDNYMLEDREIRVEFGTPLKSDECDTKATSDEWGMTESESMYHEGWESNESTDKSIRNDEKKNEVAPVSDQATSVSKELTVTYWATIECGNEKIQIPIDSSNVSGPEKAVTTTSLNKVWAWVQESNLQGKVGLQEAYNLAKNMSQEEPTEESCSPESQVLDRQCGGCDELYDDCICYSLWGRGCD